MEKWEYNVIDQRNHLKGIYTEDMIDKVLDAFGEDGWELVGWFGTWFIFKRKLRKGK